MIRVLLELWPALLPLLLCGAWVALRRRQAAKRCERLPDWRHGPWFQAVLASIGVAMACLLLAGLLMPPHKGNYTPSRLEQGRIVPGKIGP